jgi:mRNA-decapping enzyme subunit 2
MAQEKMTLEDWLDDLCVRFIINLPQEDLMSVARICFQVEEAHWFYEDFIRPLDPTLPNMSLRDFCLRMFQHCPLLASFPEENHLQAYQEFIQYKTRIPVRGAIMLNHDMDCAVLVRGWKKQASWSFPRGKINKEEDDLDCAIREVYEETGFDLREAGLVPEGGDTKSIEVTLRDQQVRLYVFRDVPMDTYFEPRTRKEIGKIQWYKLQDLPAFRRKKGRNEENEGNGGNGGNGAEASLNANKFYMVAPFLVPLKKWVVQQKKRDAQNAARHSGQMPPLASRDDVFVGDDDIAHDTDRSLPPQHIPFPNGNSSGAALLSILQPKAAAVNSVPAANMHVHAPMGHTFSEPPQPQMLQHQYPNEQMQFSGYNQHQPFPMAPGPNSGFQPQQYQSRPQVHMTMDANGRPNILVSPLQQQSQPQLLHPQPQPPQVQQSLLMRGMLSTPSVPDLRVSSGPPQSSHNFPQHAQANPFIQQGGAATGRIPSQPSAHSMNLLSVFKGNPAPPKVEQPANQTRPPPPTDKHRSGLLDMFKQGDTPKDDHTSNQNIPPPRSLPTLDTMKPMSTAEKLRTAAEENGRPLVMNPELNLPFGALSIASRPKQGVTEKPVTTSTLSISRAPDASALPLPSIKPRQEASAEQKSTLLSLFGKNKGKEPAAASPEIRRPKSRVASIASAAGPASRRSSQTTPTSTPLSPADQQFLLGFLHNASKTTRL